MIKLHGLSQEEVSRIFPANMILAGYRGSIAHGMYFDPKKVRDSIDDKDLMGVCIGPKESVYGLEVFEQHEVFYNEWDSVTYELRKFMRLLYGSNPNVLSLLWLQPQHYVYMDDLGRELIAARGMFVTKKIYYSFTGYAYSQLKRMTHFAFNGYMGAKRKSLVERFGFDTKNAAHLIRLLRMGIEFLRDGELHVLRHDAQQLMEIKRGEWTLDQVKAEADLLFKRAEQAYDECKLPNEPDKKKVNDLLIELYDEGYRRIS